MIKSLSESSIDKWVYCRLYASHFDEVIEAHHTERSIKWAIWLNNLGATGDGEYIKLFEEMTKGDRYLWNAVQETIKAIHICVGQLGLQGWELTSIHHQAIFYQNEYFTYFVPAFYFKKQLHQAKPSGT